MNDDSETANACGATALCRVGFRSPPLFFLWQNVHVPGKYSCNLLYAFHISNGAKSDDDTILGTGTSTCLLRAFAG